MIPIFLNTIRDNVQSACVGSLRYLVLLLCFFKMPVLPLSSAHESAVTFTADISDSLARELAFGSGSIKKSSDGHELGKKQLRQKAISNFVRFCEDVAVDPLDSCASYRKALLCTFKCVDKRSMYTAVYGDDGKFLDWENVEKQSRNRIGDATTCIEFLTYCCMDEVSKQERQLCHEHPLISNFRQSLQGSGLDIEFQECCRLIVLNNLVGISGSQVTELFLSWLLNADVHNRVLKCMGMMVDFRYSTSEYTAALGAILREIRVNPTFEKETSLHIHQRNSLKMAMKQKYMQISQGRPRLRDRVHKSAMDSGLLSYENVDSFDSWCVRTRFPPTTSLQIRRKAYFLMSQTKLEPERFMKLLMGSDELASRALSCKISRPEPAVLSEVTASVKIFTEPFPQIAQFRSECFNALAYTQSLDLTMQRLVQLYIAAYQPSEVWKEVWKSIFPVLSHQLIVDVENFVREHPINASEAMKLLIQS